MDVGKIQPNDIEAEQATLGAMLLDGEAVTSAVEVLKPEDFYREENKLIFSAMVNLYGRSEPIDIITVKDELVLLRKARCLWWDRIYCRTF
jgi:replicative DNA helicase